MINSENHGTSKVHCAICDRVFDSRAQYTQHVLHVHSHNIGSNHDNGASCDSCPLDIAISKLLGLFKRK